MAQANVLRQSRRFIAQYIDSVAALEALLLLRATPHETWEISRVASRLYITEAETGRVLDRLCRDGLLVVNDEGYRYECKTNELQRAVDEISGLYTQHLIPITNMIHAKSRRIREFADAFRFRKDS